jgi:lipoprotein-releasing system permease protein
MPRRHRLPQITAFFAVAGIGAGVAALLLAQAVAAGFRAAFVEKILANSAHIAVFSGKSDLETAARKIAAVEGVRTISAAAFDSVLLVGKIDSAFASLRGISEIENQRPIDANRRPKIFIGKIVAEKTGLQTGDSAEIVSADLTANSAPRVTTVEVGGTFATGFYEYDAVWIQTDFVTAREIAYKTNAPPDALEIKTANPLNAPQIAEKIRRILGADFQVLDWQTMNEPFFSALTVEKQAAVFIIGLIVLVAVLNVTTTLALLVGERRADIAVLKTCGAQTKSILLIFFAEGFLLGAAGVFTGILTAVLIGFAANRCGLIRLSPEVYSVAQIELQFDLTFVLLTAATALLLSLIASVFPAFVAAQTKPLENLKN